MQTNYQINQNITEIFIPYPSIAQDNSKTSINVYEVNISSELFKIPDFTLIVNGREYMKDSLIRIETTNLSEGILNMLQVCIDSNSLSIYDIIRLANEKGYESKIKLQFKVVTSIDYGVYEEKNKESLITSYKEVFGLLDGEEGKKDIGDTFEVIVDVQYEELDSFDKVVYGNIINNNIKQIDLKSVFLNQDISSVMLLRTSPKLTGNIKLVVDSKKDLYFDTFKVSKVLSSRQYRKQKISTNNSLPYDIRRIYSDVPSYDFYDVQKEYYNTRVAETNKYNYVDMTYSYGVSTNSDSLYSENYSFLAPLMIKNELPDYFCIFRVGDNLTSMTDVINEGVLVASYSFDKSTVLGEYMHKYLDVLNGLQSFYTCQYTNSSDFSSINENSFTGLSIKKGIPVTIKETTYNQSKIIDDTTNHPFERYNIHLSDVFMRHNLVIPNIINFEFMFNDEAELFSVNKYVGFYITKNEFISIEGTYRDRINNIHHLNKKQDEVKTDTLIERFNNIFESDLTSGILVMADTSDNEVIRLSKSEDYENFLKDYILNHPDKSILDVKGDVIEDDEFPYREFINLKIEKSLSSGNHLRFIFPNREVKIDKGVGYRVENGSIIPNEEKIKEPLIIDVIASSDVNLKNTDNISKLPSVYYTESERFFAGMFDIKNKFITSEDNIYNNEDINSFLNNIRIYYAPKSRNYWDGKLYSESNTYSKKLNEWVEEFDTKYEKNGFNEESIIGYVKTSFETYKDKSKFVKFDIEEDVVKATYLSPKDFNKDNISHIVNIVDVYGDVNYTDIISDRQSYIYLKHPKAKIIHVSYLCNDIDFDNIERNIDYYFKDYNTLISKEETLERIINALKVAIEYEGLEAEITQSSETDFTFATNEKDSIFEQIFPIVMNQTKDEEIIDLYNISVMSDHRNTKNVGWINSDNTDPQNISFTNYLLYPHNFCELAKTRPYVAYKFVKKPNYLLEIDVKDIQDIDKNNLNKLILYKNIDIPSMEVRYSNISSFNIDNFYIKDYNDLKNLLYNSNELNQNLRNYNTTLEDIIRSDSNIQVESETNELISIPSPIHSKKRVIGVDSLYIGGENVKLYKSKSHTVFLGGINNIVDLSFNIDDTDIDRKWNLESIKNTNVLSEVQENLVSSIILPTDVNFKFSHISLNNNGEQTHDLVSPVTIFSKLNKVEDNIKVKIGQYKKLFNYIDEEHTTVFETLINNNKVNNILLEEVLFWLRKNDDNNDLKLVYTKARYNNLNRVLTFNVFDHNISLEDENLNSLILSNFNNYDISYYVINNDNNINSIYFVFDNLTRSIIIIHLISVNSVLTTMSNGTPLYLNNDISKDAVNNYKDVGVFLNYSPNGYEFIYIDDKDKEDKTSVNNLGVSIFQTNTILDKVNPNTLTYNDINKFYVMSKQSNIQNLTVGDVIMQIQSLGENNVFFINKNIENNEIKSTILKTLRVKNVLSISNNKNNTVTLDLEVLTNNVSFFDKNTTNKIQDLESRLGINLYGRNLILEGVQSITQSYKKITEDLNIDKSSVQDNYYTKNIYPNVFDNTYRLYDNALTNFETNDILQIDKKFYFDSSAISLYNSKSNTYGNVIIDNWEQDILFEIVNDNVRINLERCFMVFVQKYITLSLQSLNLSEKDIREYIINKFSKYYVFGLDNIDFILYEKKLNKIDNQNSGKILYSEPNKVEERYNRVTNIKADIVSDNSVVYYEFDKSVFNNSEIYFKLIFKPNINQKNLQSNSANTNRQ